MGYDIKVGDIVKIGGELFKVCKGTCHKPGRCAFDDGEGGCALPIRIFDIVQCVAIDNQFIFKTFTPKEIA